MVEAKRKYRKRPMVLKRVPTKESLDAKYKTGLRQRRITLELFERGGQIFATNGGSYEFPLEYENGLDEEDILRTPIILINGQVWKGRYYPRNGWAHFQKTKARRKVAN